MNQGAKIISESIIGSDFRTVFVNGKAYTVYPPTIHKLAGAISHLSDVQEAENLKNVLLSLEESEAYSKALSWLITGDESLSEELAKGTYEENVNALDEAFSMIDSKVFLKAGSETEERKPAGSETEVVGNDTLLGQIASFMENLHLSYREVVYEIPYRNLVLMQRDKLHTVTGTKVTKVKGKDMASRRRRNKK